MHGMREIAERASGIFSCAGGRPDVRRGQAAGVVGVIEGFASAGGAHVPDAGREVRGNGVSEGAGGGLAEVSGAGAGAASGEEAGDGGDAGAVGLAFSTQLSAFSPCEFWVG